jgi:hypothetical protein
LLPLILARFRLRVKSTPDRVVALSYAQRADCSGRKLTFQEEPPEEDSDYRYMMNLLILVAE